MRLRHISTNRSIAYIKGFKSQKLFKDFFRELKELWFYLWATKYIIPQTIEDPSPSCPQASAMMNRRGKGYSVRFPESLG